MNDVVELPLAEPLYSTYHFQGPCTAVAVENPTMRNWILNQSMMLVCSRKFLEGRTTPEIDILKSAWILNPHLEKIHYPWKFAGGYINPIIRSLLDQGWYVCFSGVDDYYVEGKSWYREKHFIHDGMICGYNRTDQTYCLYAYDSHWIYRKFWTPQSAFNRGREAAQKNGGKDGIWGIRAKAEPVPFSPAEACRNLREYLHPPFEKYPAGEEDNVYGIMVQPYIALYVEKLQNDSIPHERMDRRVFRLIWEHKKVMQERIALVEKTLELEPVFSRRYAAVVSEADTLRMLYASYHMRKRDSLLPAVHRGILQIYDREKKILTAFLSKAEEVLRSGTVEPAEGKDA